MKRSPCTQAALAIALALMATSASAQQPAPVPAVDPAAIKALEGMSAYLRNLKSFQVVAVTTTDDVAENGQSIQSSGKTTIVARMPDRLFADVSSDKQERRYLYDGKNFTLWARRAKFYATVPAPPTLGQLDDVLQEKYDMEIPLADLFRFGGPKWSAADIRAASVIGPSGVDGVSCMHYAFRQDDVDFQVWIQRGDHPLPRKLVIVTTSDPERPQHSATYDWNLAPSFDDSIFTFTPPEGAGKVVLAVAK
jgi:hypothetical protein